MTEPFEVREVIDMDQPIEAVWDGLVTQNGLQRWLDARLFVLEIDDNGRIEIPFVRGDTAVTIVGDTSFINPPQQLIFTWIERDKWGQEWLFPTIVSLELAPQGDGTRMTLAHKGFKRLPTEEREAILSQYQDYWREKTGEYHTKV